MVSPRKKTPASKPKKGKKPLKAKKSIESQASGVKQGISNPVQSVQKSRSETPFAIKRSREKKITPLRQLKRQLFIDTVSIGRETDAPLVVEIEQRVESYLAILRELFPLSRKKEIEKKIRSLVKKHQLVKIESETEEIVDKVEYCRKFVTRAANALERREIMESIELCLKLQELKTSKNEAGKREYRWEFYVRLDELLRGYTPKADVKQEALLSITRRGARRKTRSGETHAHDVIWTIPALIRTTFPILQKNMSKWFRQLDSKKFWTALLSKNRFAKLFSIVASLFIFLYMQSQNIVEKNFLVPLNVVKNSDISIANEIPTDLTVFVSGTKDSLLSLDINRMYSELNLYAEQEGSYVYKPLLRGIPNNIQILRVSPEEIEVTVSALDRKLLTIEPEFIGVPHSDFYLVRYSIEPRRLWVTGPQEILSDITALKTEPISIENIKSNKELQVLLNKSTHPSIEVDLEREFSVFLYLRSKFISESIDGEFPVETGFPRNGLYLANKLTVDKVSYEVLEDIVEGFDAYENFTFSLDTEKIKSPGFYSLKVAVEPISGIRIKSFTPSSVVIEVRSTNKPGGDLKESSVSPLVPPLSRNQ